MDENLHRTYFVFLPLQKVEDYDEKERPIHYLYPIDNLHFHHRMQKEERAYGRGQA